MNLQSMFRDFNPGKFIVWVCLSIFTCLFSLRLDNAIDWSYWVVFAPLWVWKGLVIVGAFIGNIVWIKNPHYRLEGQSFVQYRALLTSLGIHMFILLFELLVADNLESQRHAWVFVFAPLVFISTFSIGACVWAVKHDRSFELELFCSVNLLQFIFISLRLDGYMDWKWEIVFIPAWILLCMSILGVLYAIILAGLMLRMTDINPDRRRTSMNTAISHTCLLGPILIFLVSLSIKLNNHSSSTYTYISWPLYISYSTLIAMSFNTKRANQWWFGLRKDVCQFLLGVCPLLQEYANISYSIPHSAQTRGSRSSEESRSTASDSLNNRVQPAQSVITNEKKDVIATSRRIDQRAVVPALSLEVPD